jgi:hypothetical protein
MVDFAKLKSMSGKKSLDQINSHLNKLANQDSGKKGADNRFWAPTVDKAGNGMAIIRFLPPTEGEDVPFIRLYDHGFQGPTGLWYIENSLTTIGKPDPVSEYNSKLWSTGVEADKEIVRKQKRRLHFISNIYVIQDQANPQNEGKVFLFKYGKKIFDKLNEAMNPQFEDEQPINPFDLWEGANFKLKIRNVDGYRNYDKSEFDKIKPLFEDDDEIEVVWKKQYSLEEFIKESNFKPYDQLKERLSKVLNIVPENTSSRKIDEAAAPSFKESKYKTAATSNLDDEHDDETIEFFKQMAG